jgi:hypothetical protein
MDNIFITKADGSKERFSELKLRKSLQKAGASSELAHSICEHIRKEIIEGISSQRIYEHAFFLLKQQERALASKYSLKRAIADFGPSGFPFEKFIAEIFKSMGYTARTGQRLMGKCVDHEVDVVAINENEFVVVEAKFHNQIGTKSDTKVPLYVNSRIEDLKLTNFDGMNVNNLPVDPWIVTNTKFTRSALAYGNCVGLNMVDWSYPKGRGLRELVEDADLHPVTAITRLNRNEINEILKQEVVLSKTLLGRKDLLVSLGISERRISDIFNEIRQIIK